MTRTTITLGQPCDNMFILGEWWGAGAGPDRLSCIELFVFVLTENYLPGLNTSAPARQKIGQLRTQTETKTKTFPLPPTSREQQDISLLYLGLTQALCPTKHVSRYTTACILYRLECRDTICSCRELLKTVLVQLGPLSSFFPVMPDGKVRLWVSDSKLNILNILNQAVQIYLEEMSQRYARSSEAIIITVSITSQFEV